MTILRVREADYPHLIVGTLTVMRESELDFDIPRLSSLDPSSGELQIAGPGAEQAIVLIREFLSGYGVRAIQIEEP